MPDEVFLDLHFPKAGLNVVCPFGRQPNRPTGTTQQYCRTTPVGTNVRGFDATADRFRGGTRSGLSRKDGFMRDRVSGLWVVQELNSVVSQSVVSPEAGMLLTGLCGYYKLDGDLLDSSGHERNLFLGDATQYTDGSITIPLTGKINHALLAGSGFRHPLGGITDNRLTLSAWMWASDEDGRGGGTGFGRGAEMGNALRLVYVGDSSGTGFGKFKVRDRSNLDVLETGFTYNLSAWHLVVLRYTGTSVELWVDNVMEDSLTYTIDAGWSLLSFGIDGAGEDITTPIDEVGVWNRALTDDELTFLWNSGVGLVPSNTPGGGAQLSQTGRTVTLVAVSQGVVKVANIGDTAWTTATNNTGETPPLNYTGVMASASNVQKLYFADGINYVYYDPVTNSVELWVASAGTLPVDSEGNTPRLICTWRDRMVLSGLTDDPQNIFMSAVGNPNDFDYAPVSGTPTQAVALNLAAAGRVGDTVTTLIPYSDDVLLVGGDHTINMLRGDPFSGGQVDLISDAIGMAWSTAWCKDPYGTVYFFSNRCGIYALVPGQQPIRISQAIETLVQGINTGRNILLMAWDDRAQGFHLFVTWVDEPAITDHYFWEQRTGAWWQVRFANTDHNPLCCTTFDGNEPDDRMLLVGCWDGYVRVVDPNAVDDDGTDIESEVWIGPLLTKDLDDVMLHDLQSILGETSGAVDWAVYSADTAEAALASQPVATGTWEAGRNLTDYVRSADHAHFLRLSSTNQWALEAVRCRIRTLGKIRRRGH